MRLIKRILRYFKHHKKTAVGTVIALLVIAFLLRPKAPVPPQTITVKRSNLIQSVSTSGKVGAKNVVGLSFLAGGKLTYLGVKTGDHVNQYQTIATLDQRTAQKNLQAALLDYSKQRNTFETNLETNNPNHLVIDNLNQQLKRIFENNQSDLDKAVNSVELQALAAENSVLTTPIAGIVTRADAKSSGVNVGPTTVFEVTDPNSLVFDMDVDEADVGKISVGQQSSIILDAYPDQTVKLPVNYIDFVSHATSTGGTAYTVEVALNDPGAMKYRVGMDGNAEIITAQRNNVITVPIASVVDDTYVYIKTGKYFVKRPVTLGLQNDTDTEVTSGLQTGDVIAVQPTEAAKFPAPKRIGF